MNHTVSRQTFFITKKHRVPSPFAVSFLFFFLLKFFEQNLFLLLHKHSKDEMEKISFRSMRNFLK